MLYKEKDKPFKGGDLVSKDLLKTAGLGLIALLVVCNTYRIHNMSKATHSMSGYARRVAANVENRKQRPAIGQRHGQAQRGSKGSGDSKGYWEGMKGRKQQKPKAK